ncbi:ABC transporter, ATP-binding protein [Alteracholeplasma palmae J233]|uniref:ABC transporter, ATP-binding protein n=1 Tax=Alteracholeplasma palmae (strain ATCC 49389 / J233) TaxID=1318466 RepID=U4KRX0_ALTPJ|nr:ABC transporter ATP-binding protein [Alteracholeplasma palmae]CCV64516.1 ABC transporter, ATP-binding protein [Alteracholeplasma palmae J233]
MIETLIIKNVKKTFKLSKKQQRIDKTTDKEKIAVNGLSFTAYEGEVYGLLGSNGAGKTTTLRMISTLIKPDEGDIIVSGISSKEDPTEIRRRIGFLTSELKLEEFFTPNYMFNFYSDLYQVPLEVREERKKHLFDKFEIHKFAEVKIGDLSTGMKQKISLAISLVNDPKIIIFDEPTNGLDVLTAKDVTDLIIELKNKGYTIILSTHIFSLVEKVCDRVGIIIDGKMALEGKISELTKEKNIESIFFDEYAKAKGRTI